MEIVRRQDQVWSVANDLNIPKSHVESVIVSYTELMRKRIMAKETVRVYGRVLVKPSETAHGDRGYDSETLALQAYSVSKDTGIGYQECLSILEKISQYVKEIPEMLMTYQFYGLMTVTPDGVRLSSAFRGIGVRARKVY